jgi:putative membrane protein
MKRELKDYLLLYAKGIGMGAADVVPGVSGGTVAFITGIYEELINSIKSINGDALKLLLRFKLIEFWKSINANFLIVVLAGITTSLLSLSKLMTYFLEFHPIQIWSFFFGLILVSSPLILRDILKWDLFTSLSFVAGIAIAYLITILSPTETPTNLGFIFFCGALAICAMILPGISGAFILLLIGKYEYMINALISFDLPVIMVFVLGCFLGLLGFSRFLSWILTHYRFPTLALLAGFMIGSLNKVWPWKEVIAYRINHEGQQVPALDRSILPAFYFEKTGADPQLFQAILFTALGIFLVVAIEKTASYLKSKA